ncbi:Gldg family protein [Butyricimonas hominis]|uniref:Gldg family protein n=1 Tax=Butyricimonas hominis TaxID=2763032 RepID=A0ABR7D6A6_9BACT|nr:Gldg family protein [Butyricimonas hominis]MBC5622845.1 Gldg family protein [Butyricimonas hominis]
MKTIYKIAKLELANLFYSPIAWFILIIFMLQMGINFGEMMGSLGRFQELGRNLMNLTARVYYGGMGGLLRGVSSSLYLYIPLLTMGLLSQEFSRGSVKLLFSAPITSWQIVLGKYVGIMIYGFCLMLVIGVYVAIGWVTIENFDWRPVLIGMLGLYFLLGAYAAIGLFMSSLTSYQIVAALGTFVVFALLNLVGRVGQDIEFVRDITYWLSLGGRVNTFLQGMVCSEDVLYFIIVIAMFLSSCFLKIQLGRARYSGLSKMMRYGGVFAVAMLAGYVTSRPVLKVYYDGTYTKANTISEASQDIVKRLDGGMTITTYVNLLDNVYSFSRKGVLSDMAFFEKYVRFKPDIRMKYVFYYDEVDNPKLEQMYPGLSAEEKAKKVVKAANLNLDDYLSPEQIRERVDLSEEGNHFVRILERDNGQTARLRIFTDMQKHPSETEVSATLKRMVMKLPKVGFLKGHGERSITRNKNRDYSLFAYGRYFRHSLLNQGFDVVESELEPEKDNLQDIDILVIADPLEAFEDWELEQLSDYIDRGNNLIIAGEPKNDEYLAPVLEKFGIRYVPGTLVQPMEEFPADLLVVRSTLAGARLSRVSAGWRRSIFTMPGAMGIDSVADKGFRMIPLLVSRDSGCWNEVETTDFVNGTVKLNPAAGEREARMVTAMALERECNGRNQRVLVLGDADCISMGELSAVRRGIRASNFSLIQGAFCWLSDEELPVDIRHPNPIDNKIFLGISSGTWVKVFVKWILPSVLLLLGMILLLRRQRK